MNMKTIEEILEEKRVADKQRDAEEAKQTKKRIAEAKKWRKKELPQILTNEVEAAVSVLNKRIKELKRSTGDSDCRVIINVERHGIYNSTVLQELNQALTDLGYSAKVTTTSGGSDYDSDGIAHSHWTSQYITVDLVPIRDMLYNSGI